MTLPNESSSLTRGEKTKYRLAESMKECMCHTPVDAITVRQITENCGLTRQTFYRNFMDKFDLINWYFDKLLIKSFEYMGQGKTVQEGLQLKFSYIGEEKVIALLLMQQIAVLFLIMGLGFLIVKLGIVKTEDSRVLSMVTIYLVLPCVTIHAFQIEYSTNSTTWIRIATATASRKPFLIFVEYSI